MNEISFEVRERDLIAFNEHLAQQSEPLRKQVHRHQATIPGIMVVISLLFWFYYKDSLSAIYVGLIALAWGFGMPAYLKWSMRRQIRRMYTAQDRESMLGEFSLRAEPSDLVEKHGTAEARTPWQDVLRIEATKRYAFLYVGPQAAFIIPRAAIKSGDLHAFVKSVDQLIAQAE